MNINELPDKCPRCSHTIFRQKIKITGFATKIYFPTFNPQTIIEKPVNIEEDLEAKNNYYNSVLCNACGTTIVEADVTRSSKRE